jgi:hypothetical protein
MLLFPRFRNRQQHGNQNLIAVVPLPLMSNKIRPLVCPHIRVTYSQVPVSNIIVAVSAEPIEQHQRFSGILTLDCLPGAALIRQDKTRGFRRPLALLIDLSCWSSLSVGRFSDAGFCSQTCHQHRTHGPISGILWSAEPKSVFEVPH